MDHIFKIPPEAARGPPVPRERPGRIIAVVGAGQGSNWPNEPRGGFSDGSHTTGSNYCRDSPGMFEDSAGLDAGDRKNPANRFGGRAAIYPGGSGWP